MCIPSCKTKLALQPSDSQSMRMPGVASKHVLLFHGAHEFEKMTADAVPAVSLKDRDRNMNYLLSAIQSVVSY